MIVYASVALAASLTIVYVLWATNMLIIEYATIAGTAVCAFFGIFITLRERYCPLCHRKMERKYILNDVRHWQGDGYTTKFTCAECHTEYGWYTAQLPRFDK